MNMKIIVVLVAIDLFLIIFAQNDHVVTLRLLFWEIGISQIFLLPLTLCIGFFVLFHCREGSERSGKHGKKERR
jgi:uncharacterized integral membrane protein